MEKHLPWGSSIRFQTIPTVPTTSDANMPNSGGAPIFRYMLVMAKFLLFLKRQILPSNGLARLPNIWSMREVSERVSGSKTAYGITAYMF